MTFTPFPHQFSDLAKFRQVLKTIDQLLGSGNNIDDVSLGYALHLNGIIRQRGSSSLSVEQQLEIIKLKPKSNQSPLTIARDVRRTFQLFGLLREVSGTFQITDRGRVIADTPPQSQITIEEKKSWLKGLHNLTLQQLDETSTFRPLKGIMELLADNPIETRLLVFVFTLKDESNEEIKRIKAIVDRISSGETDFETEIELAEISPSNARNSVKILPAIAEKLGLINRARKIASITPYGQTFLDLNYRQVPPISTEPTPVRIQSRYPFFRIIKKAEEFRRKWKPQDTEEGEVDFDPQDFTKRMAHLRERTDEHQDTLVKLYNIFQDKGWRIGIGNFDLFTEKGSIALLHEVKTLIAGDITDERLRIIDGLGKLMFYEAFDIPPLLTDKSVNLQKVFVFSMKPNKQEHIEFLKSIGIWVIWFNSNGEIDGESGAVTELNKLLS